MTESLTNCYIRFNFIAHCGEDEMDQVKLVCRAFCIPTHKGKQLVEEFPVVDLRR